MQRKSATALAIALIAALFLGGVAVGIAVDRTWLAPAETAAPVELPRRLDRFARRLELSAEQRQKVRAILDETRSGIGRMTAEAQRRILEILTPDQADRYQRMLERRMHRGGRRRHRR